MTWKQGEVFFVAEYHRALPHRGKASAFLVTQEEGWWRVYIEDSAGDWTSQAQWRSIEGATQAAHRLLDQWYKTAGLESKEIRKSVRTAAAGTSGSYRSGYSYYDPDTGKWVYAYYTGS